MGHQLRALLSSSGHIQHEAFSCIPCRKSRHTISLWFFEDSMCEGWGEWLSPWERDAKGRRLSVIINLDGANPRIAFRDYDALRPVFIDGPSIGHAYDEDYHENSHLHLREPSQNNGSRSVPHSHRPFPVMALCQTLFAFTSRGHKCVALLPAVYDERTPDGKVTNDIRQLVDDVPLLRKLVKMQLVEFVRNFLNFGTAVRSIANKAYGALVTCTVLLALDVPNSVKKSAEEGGGDDKVSQKKDENLRGTGSGAESGGRGEEGPESDGADANWDMDEEDEVVDTVFPTTESVPDHRADTAAVSERQQRRSRKRVARHDQDVCKLPVGYLPIIKPLFYTMLREHRMSLPMDSPCFPGVFPTTEQMLVFPTRVDSDREVSELAKHGQLTLFRQYRLLEELDVLLQNHYPCGPKEKRVVEMVKQMWVTSGEERREAEDPLNDGGGEGNNLSKLDSAQNTPEENDLIMFDESIDLIDL